MASLEYKRNLNYHIKKKKKIFKKMYLKKK
jgi:hypothetical protein